MYYYICLFKQMMSTEKEVNKKWKYITIQEQIT